MQHIGKKNFAGGRREGKSLCRKDGGNTVSLKPLHPRAQYEVGSRQMLASTALVWSPGVSVIGRKASEASFPCVRMDRAFVGFLGSTKKTSEPTLDQMLSLCNEKLSTPDSPLIMLCF